MSEKSNLLTPSTVEAIRMASASVLGTTTKQGYPLGSAIGSGSMLEQHAESVAMNVTPLIFEINEALRESEGLELLCVEWNLDHVPGPEVLPEQLVVSGGSVNGVSSYVSVLSWERGVVDPFKIDSHLRGLTRKLSGIESAVLNNNLNYETNGIQTLKRFSNRLNSVLFVDMIDRRFQASWDSFQLKKENVDVQFTVNVLAKSDFTTLPPGPKIVKKSDLLFSKPQYDESKLLQHFGHRILTPRGIDIISARIPEVGKSIISELNSFAYSIEEMDIAQVIIQAIVEFIGTSCISVSDIQSISSKAVEFQDYIKKTVEICENLLEEHIKSGMNLNLESHQEQLLTSLESIELSPIVKKMTSSILLQAMKALEREYSADLQLRAWELKSTLRYFVAFTQRVAQYFVKEFKQYLIVAAARKAFVAALDAFKAKASKDTWDSTDQMLFEKFYDELFTQLNAIFDKTTYEGAKQSDIYELNRLIASDMVELFKIIDMWELVDFRDVASIARDEIRKRYGESSDEGSNGQALLDILDSLERLVFEITPELSDYLLSKSLIREIISIKDIRSTILKHLDAIEKPYDWKSEAMEWLRDIEMYIEPHNEFYEKIMHYLQFIHEKAGTGFTAKLVVDRVVTEAEQLEREYNEEVSQWEATCKAIDEENENIRQYNQKKQTLLKETEDRYQSDLAQYEEAMAEYNRMKELASTSETPIELPPLPSQPTPLSALINKVNDEYPPKEEKQKPPKPEPSQEFRLYKELRELLTEKLSRMDENQEAMENTFSDHLEQLKSGRFSSEDTLEISIGDEFQEFLLTNVMRNLGRVFPKVNRAFLRDPDIQDLLYLVTYAYQDDAIRVTVGDNFLR